MEILEKVDLQRYNSLRLRSIADHFAIVRSEAELADALSWARTRDLPVNIIGTGSNVVFLDRVEGLTILIQTAGVELISDDGEMVELRVAAGENLHAFVTWCLKNGFHGLENLAWIPGTVGAVPIQNVGAYGVEASTWISAIHVLKLSTGESSILTNEQCKFDYRDSIFKHSQGSDFIISAVDFRLSRRAEPEADYPTLRAELGGLAPTPQRIYDAVVAVRKRRIPDIRKWPNAGSFFKNPAVSWHEAEVMGMRWPQMPQFSSADGKIKLSAAWMIDLRQWKGVIRDGAGVHPDHALVLYNAGADTAVAMLNLADEIVDSVWEAFEIKLEIEPRVIGERF